MLESDGRALMLDARDADGTRNGCLHGSCGLDTIPNAEKYAGRMCVLRRILHFSGTHQSYLIGIWGKKGRDALFTQVQLLNDRLITLGGAIL
jgi:hypothetical protein